MIKPFHQIAKDEAKESPALRVGAPVSWRQDHFETLLYIEKVCVEKQGQPEQTDLHTKWNEFAARLHDRDYLNDFLHTRLIEKTSEVGGDIRLTDLGWRVAAALRRHKAEGKGLNEFQMTRFFEPKLVWYLSIEYDLNGEVFEEVRGVFDSIEAIESYLPIEIKNSYGEMDDAFSAYIAYSDLLNVTRPRLNPLSDNPWYLYRHYDRDGRLIPSKSIF